MPNRLIAASLAAILGLATPARPCLAADAPPAAHCSTPVYREFDFWLGDWDTYRVDSTGKVPTGAPSVARNLVTAILGGCVLHETYRRSDGYTGESFTIYDTTRHVWHQSRVTNEGELLVAEGGRRGKSIVLTGSSRDAQGAQLLKVSWTPQGDGVRETALQSRDDGKNWTPLFDILFRPHSH